MDFNIKKILERKQQQSPEWRDRKTCSDVLSDYVVGIKSQDIALRAGVIVLEKIHPSRRTFVKLNKQKILDKIQKNGVHVRDII